MTTSAPSVRTLTKAKVRDLLGASQDLAGVQINYGQFATPENERVSFGSVTGQLEVIGYSQGQEPTAYLDTFTLTLIIVVDTPGTDDAQDADSRVEELTSAVIEATTALNLATDVPGLMASRIGTYNGPNSYEVENQGHGSFATVEIECQIQIN